MAPAFYGIVQKIDVSSHRIVVRCVREFFSDHGLMDDDVCEWEIAQPNPVGQLQPLVGRVATSFEVYDNGGGQSLRIWLDDGDDDVTLSGASVTQKSEPRNADDLKRLIAVLGEHLQTEQRGHDALRRRLNDISSSIHNKIDRLQRREEFEGQRKSDVASAISREIENLEAVLRQIKEAS